VLNAEEIVKEPHLNERGLFQVADHPVAGPRPYTIAHPRLSDTPVEIREAAPCFAQHNDHVFKDILGMSEQEIDRLKAEGIISDKVLENEA
jgi:crotonobetainyl-CoA:carnitine CoA-transferase CaiB-like acyl-CoA transferase